MICTVDLSPICSSLYRPGPPSSKAQALTIELQELLEGSLDFNQLNISKDYAYTVYVDVVCLSDDGNLVDYCVEAAVSALDGLCLPEFDLVEDQLVANGSEKKLILTSLPAC